MSGQSIAIIGAMSALISAIVAGGAAFITGRATARRTGAETRGLEAKLPAEVDSVVVQGAEAAVLTMNKALESANRRIDQLEAEREADRKRIEALESQVGQFRQQLQTAEEHLGAARKTGEDLTAQLTKLMRDQGKRPR